MANIHPDIRPGALATKDLVNAMYMITASIAGICAKLDADDTVNDATYLANCYTALYSTIIEDGRGNRTGVVADATRAKVVMHNAVDTAALIEWLYQTFNAIETLTEQLDADSGVTGTDYEANCYTALLTHMVTNQTGNTLGNGNTFYFNPGGAPERELVDCLYNLFNCIETLTEQLDADGGVTDTDYEALWFTAVCLMRIEDSKGNVVGNDSSTYKG